MALGAFAPHYGAAADAIQKPRLRESVVRIGDYRIFLGRRLLAQPVCEKVDERADIYSLGVILYELFTGVPPYSRGDHMSVMYQHVQGKARQPIEINKQLPQELNNLVMKCMSLDKAKRSQTMDELRTSLEKFL